MIVVNLVKNVVKSLVGMILIVGVLRGVLRVTQNLLFGRVIFVWLKILIVIPINNIFLVL